jgi:hypothetical protein
VSPPLTSGSEETDYVVCMRDSELGAALLRMQICVVSDILGISLLRLWSGYCAKIHKLSEIHLSLPLHFSKHSWDREQRQEILQIVLVALNSLQRLL